MTLQSRLLWAGDQSGGCVEGGREERRKGGREEGRKEEERRRGMQCGGRKRWFGKVRVEHREHTQRLNGNSMGTCREVSRTGKERAREKKKQESLSKSFTLNLCFLQLSKMCSPEKKRKNR